MDNVIEGGFQPRPVARPSYPSLAHEKVAQLGLRVWRHVGAEGVNVHDEILAKELAELGCKVTPYQPERVGNPDRLAWEVILPRPSLEVVSDA